MARFNEIQAGRINRALQKFVGIKGSSPTPQLASEVVPIFPLFWGVENRYLEQWNLFAQSFQVANVAANNSMIRLRNPSTSKVVAVVTMVWWQNPSPTQSNFVIEGPNTPANPVGDLASGSLSASASRFDARAAAGSAAFAPSIITSSQNNGANAGFDGIPIRQTLAQNQGNYAMLADMEIPILPGDCLQLRSQVVNVELDASVWWRERILEESELI